MTLNALCALRNCGRGPMYLLSQQQMGRLRITVIRPTAMVQWSMISLHLLNAVSLGGNITADVLNQEYKITRS